jgi:hypothetical protein
MVGHEARGDRRNIKLGLRTAKVRVNIVSYIRLLTDIIAARRGISLHQAIYPHCPRSRLTFSAAFGFTLEPTGAG